MPELTPPTTRLWASWQEAHHEWGQGLHEDGFGLLSDDDVATPVGFTAWVRRLHDESQWGQTPGAKRTHTTYWWIVEAESVLGAIALRRETNEWTLRVGHVGYGVRPSARGRGLATWALGEVLSTAWLDGLPRILVCCREDNPASARVVEHHGGVLESTVETVVGRIQRYWVTGPEATPGSSAGAGPSLDAVR